MLFPLPFGELLFFSPNYVRRHMYIHNWWRLQPFSQDYDLTSHITYVVCVHFIHEWRDLQFKFDYKRQIFEKLFMAFLFALSFCQKSAESNWPKKHFHIFVLMIISQHYLLDYGNFSISEWNIRFLPKKKPIFHSRVSDLRDNLF